jgi:hypothetical protein
MSGLLVTASVADGARWPDTCRVDVRVRNAGDATLVVCRRLAPGYAEADGRELYAEVHPPGADDVVSRMTRIYDRDPPSPDEYGPLAPGDELAGSFDLLRWYALPGPGAYELEVFYEADGRGTPHVDGVVRGVHGSGRVAFELE